MKTAGIFDGNSISNAANEAIREARYAELMQRIAQVRAAPNALSDSRPSGSGTRPGPETTGPMAFHGSSHEAAGGMGMTAKNGETAFQGLEGHGKLQVIQKTAFEGIERRAQTRHKARCEITAGEQMVKVGEGMIRDGEALISKSTYIRNESEAGSMKREGESLVKEGMATTQKGQRILEKGMETMNEAITAQKGRKMLFP